MKCDMDLIVYTYKLMNKKSKSDPQIIMYNKLYNKKLKAVSIKLGNLYKEEFCLSAIDFHCFPNIIDIINTEIDNLNPNEIKDLIWNYSSSLTNKILIVDDKSNDDKSNDDISEDKWNNIKNIYNKITYSKLYSLCNV